MSTLQQSVTGKAVTYVFDDLEAGLPHHAHRPGDGLDHDIYCFRGAVLLWFHKGDYQIIKENERVTFDCSLWHGIVPLLPNSAIVNTSDTAQGDVATVLHSPHEAPEWVVKIQQTYNQG